MDPEALKPNRTVGEILDEGLERICRKEQIPSEFVLMNELVKQLQEDAERLDAVDPDLRETVFSTARSMLKDYLEVGATIHYVTESIYARRDEAALQVAAGMQELVDIKRTSGMDTTDYLLFVGYLALTKTFSNPGRKLQEFTEVMGAVLRPFDQGISSFGRLKEVEGSWEEFMKPYPPGHPHLAIAETYQQLEARYNIQICDVERFLTRFFKK